MPESVKSNPVAPCVNTAGVPSVVFCTKVKIKIMGALVLATLTGPKFVVGPEASRRAGSFPEKHIDVAGRVCRYPVGILPVARHVPWV